ncbi:MAG TPA: alpha-hydroxy acid oxidase [Thermoplasmata archaeon]|nr:alpha-hydroxy acid oxidase [Thermoplasmata archaeon]
MPEPEPSDAFPTLSDLEEAASKRLTDRIWAYVQGGSGEERTLRANRDAFLEWALRPRMLTGVASADTSTSLLGAAVRAPLFVSPMAYHAQVHPEGELGVARAALKSGWVAAYSTLSSFSIERIAEASGGGPRWFQLYLQPDFEVSRRLVERAERAGYSALILTVDTPVLGVRDRQARGGFAIDASVPIGNGADVVPPPRPPVAEGSLYRLRAEAGSTWEVLDRLRSVTRLPWIAKGVLTAEDARLAVQHGAKAILVSNHGGRQLDGVPATLTVLPEIVEAVGSRVEVYLDGGVRRGTDVLIALALGAKAVGVGRPILWALATGGGEGVANYMERLTTEFATGLLLAGRRSLAGVDRSLVRRHDA